MQSGPTSPGRRQRIGPNPLRKQKSMLQSNKIAYETCQRLVYAMAIPGCNRRCWPTAAWCLSRSPMRSSHTRIHNRNVDGYALDITAFDRQRSIPHPFDASALRSLAFYRAGSIPTSRRVPLPDQPSDARDAEYSGHQPKSWGLHPQSVRAPSSCARLILQPRKGRALMPGPAHNNSVRTSSGRQPAQCAGCSCRPDRTDRRRGCRESDSS